MVRPAGERNSRFRACGGVQCPFMGSCYDTVREDWCTNMWINGESLADNEGSERWHAVHEWLSEKAGLDRPADAAILCPFCDTQLRTAQSIQWDDKFFDQEAKVASCSECPYWLFFSLVYVGQGPMGCPATEMLSHISKLREFGLSLPPGCADELEKYLLRSPPSAMTPGRLEELVAAIFRYNYADCDVMHVGRPSDGGVDVLFVGADRKQWLIQVKSRESPTSSEGISTIRNLLGAMVLHQSLRGIAVSTADHFTYQAYRAVARAREVGYEVALIDRGKLVRMLDPLVQDRPWLRLLAETHPQWREYFAAAIPDRRQLRLL